MGKKIIIPGADFSANAILPLIFKIASNSSITITVNNSVTQELKNPITKSASVSSKSFWTGDVTNLSNFLSSNSALLEVIDLNIDISKCTTLYNAFYNCISLEYFNMSMLGDFSNITSFEAMFKNCSKIKNVDFNGLLTPSLWRINSIFENCYSLENCDLENVNLSKVYYISGAFRNCYLLKNIYLPKNMGLLKSNPYDMSYLFAGCRNLQSVDVSMLNTIGVSSMARIFWLCANITNIDLSSWDFDSVTNTYQMFANDPLLISIDLSNFNSANISNYEDMFISDDSLSKIIVKNCNATTKTWLIARLADSKFFFTESTSGLLTKDTAWSATTYDSTKLNYVQGTTYASGDIVNVNGCTGCSFKKS